MRHLTYRVFYETTLFGFNFNHEIMKIKLLLYPFAFTFLTLAMMACDNDDDKDHHNKEMILTVASETFLFDGNEGFTPYWAKVEGESEWQNFDGIKDFTHEEGYECVLKIWREKWHDGEIMDAGIYRYKLLQILSKEKKDTENFPPQELSIYISKEKTNDPQLPYYASFTGSRDLAPFPPIEGFTHEDGKSYILRVSRNFNGSHAPSKFTYSYIETYQENPVFNE